MNLLCKCFVWTVGAVLSNSFIFVLPHFNGDLHVIYVCYLTSYIQVETLDKTYSPNNNPTTDGSILC